jgi:hypothetical protein
LAEYGSKNRRIVMFERRAILVMALLFICGLVGGNIHIGLYNHNFGSDEPVARASAFLKGLEDAPYLNEDFPLGRDVFETLSKYKDAWRKEQQESVGSTDVGDAVRW